MGFFPPEEFIPSLILGLAMIDFYAGCLDDCLKHLNCILGSHLRSGSAPEAAYYKGVTEYKISGEAGQLKITYNRLNKSIRTVNGCTGPLPTGYSDLAARFSAG